MVRPRFGGWLVWATVFYFAGCSSARNFDAQQREVAQLAGQIDGVFVGARNRIAQLRIEATRVLTGQSSDAAGRYPPSRYALFQEKALYTPKELGGCSVWASGFTPVNEDLMKKVRRLEFLEPALLAASQSASQIDSAYFHARESIDVACPFYDGATYLKPGQDLTTDFVTYREADAQHNPERKIRWVDPYVDAVGSGYMISVINPVYLGDQLEGVLGIDITVASISRSFLASVQRPYLILTGSGILVASNRAGRELLGSEGMERFYYLKGAEVNKPAPDIFRLTQHPSEPVRDLAERALKEDSFDFRWNGRDYHVMGQPIPELDWRLIGMEAR